MTAAQLTIEGVVRPHRNHGLFSDHFLDVRLQTTADWPTLVLEAQDALARLRALWTAKGGLLPQFSEAQLEDEFVRPLLREVLGHPMTVQPTLQTPFGAKRPDSVLCATQADADAMVGHALTEDILRTRGRAVAEVKAWGVRLDVAGASGAEQGLTTNPAGQIAFYIRHTGLRWGMLTDGRFSGATYGFMVGHVSPEAARGGPIALIEDGDPILIDVERRVVETSADLSTRPHRPWPVSPEATGAFAKYAAVVGSASEGAVTLPG